MDILAGSEEPSSNNYFKWRDGENKIRMLSAPIYGLEDWLDKKCYRFTPENRPAAPLVPGVKVKFFWAFIIWNYATQSVQIMQVTQAGIKESLKGLIADEDWGTPYKYDIKIVKSGAGKETKYAVSPLPHKPVTEEMKKAFYANPINLNAMYTNDDCFALGQKSYTQSLWDLMESKVVCISSIQAQELEDLLDKCDDKFKATVTKHITGPEIKAASIQALPLEHYEKIRTAVEKKVKGA